MTVRFFVSENLTKKKLGKALKHIIIQLISVLFCQFLKGKPIKIVLHNDGKKVHFSFRRC